MRLFILVFSTLFIISCNESESINLQLLVDNFYDVYSDRNDFEKFIGFYDENVILEDIISGDRIVSKDSLKNFFDWNNPSFVLLEESSLIITEKIISGNKAIVKGYFTKFSWNETEFGPMHFTTLLSFNESGKIYKQVDWINYPSNLIDFGNRKDSNSWID